MENLSIRTRSLLMNAGIKSLQELSEYTAADLLKFRNFGYKSLQEVEPYLKPFDFTIKSDNTETLANALKQIEKLEAEKAELLEALGEIVEWWHSGDVDNFIIANLIDKSDSLIKKHKQWKHYTEK